ncbi:MAG TPA: hypothetical protein DCL21_06635 [Alphaproteobacteria bacterium]|nr:hypothetical protein [Alphaproteobacteria bacterium]
MKKLILVAAITAFVAGCGSDNSANAENEPEKTYTQVEIIEKLGLPAAPDPSHPDFKKYLGVDSNGINGRDDIERAIGFGAYPNMTEINILNEMSALYKDAYNAYTSNNSDLYFDISTRQSLLMGCSSVLSDFESDLAGVVVDMYEDTQEREALALKMGREMFKDRGWPFVSNEMIKSECPKLKSK